MSDADRDWLPGKRLVSRRFKMGRCLNCGVKLSGVTGPPDDPKPESAFMVCAYCGHLMEWNGRKLVALSDQGARDAAGNQDMLAVQELVGEFQADLRPFAACAACGAPNDYGRIRCQTCGKPLVFPTSFVCPDCKAESFNRNDIVNRYCGRCHAFK
jgi:hypothetical protein